MASSRKSSSEPCRGPTAAPASTYLATAFALSARLVLRTRCWLALFGCRISGFWILGGRLLAEVELGKLWNRVGCCVGIARVDLHRILLDGADGVPMRLGTTVTTLTQEADKVVTFNDGSCGTYDLVVRADGIHSSIRQFVLPDTRPRHLGQVSWRFLVDESVAVRTWTALLGPRQAFLALPVGPNRLYCYADLAADPTRGDLDRLVALFKEFAHPVPGLISALESFDAIHFSPIEEILVDTWVHGRVVLIGDAAHATSPNMAEGASMALEDALVLAQMLATHSSPAEALSTFTERRRGRVSWVQQRTHGRDRVRKLPVPIRDLALRLAWTALYRRDYRPLLEKP
jgi:2-polyprenyl-6-methoxyphenol hydroxylase-like FAD-dependent oxidoreductase